MDEDAAVAELKTCLCPAAWIASAMRLMPGMNLSPLMSSSPGKATQPGVGFVISMMIRATLQLARRA